MKKIIWLLIFLCAISFVSASIYVRDNLTTTYSCTGSWDGCADGTCIPPPVITLPNNTQGYVDENGNCVGGDGEISICCLDRYDNGTWYPVPCGEPACDFYVGNIQFPTITPTMISNGSVYVACLYSIDGVAGYEQITSANPLCRIPNQNNLTVGNHEYALAISYTEWKLNELNQWESISSVSETIKDEFKVCAAPVEDVDNCRYMFDRNDSTFAAPSFEKNASVTFIFSESYAELLAKYKENPRATVTAYLHTKTQDFPLDTLVSVCPNKTFTINYEYPARYDGSPYRFLHNKTIFCSGTSLLSYGGMIYTRNSDYAFLSQISDDEFYVYYQIETPTFNPPELFIFQGQSYTNRKYVYTLRAEGYGRYDSPPYLRKSGGIDFIYQFFDVKTGTILRDWSTDNLIYIQLKDFNKKYGVRMKMFNGLDYYPTITERIVLVR